MYIERDLFENLDALAIPYQTYRHSPVLTVQEAEVVCANLPPFGHCKNLFLKDRKKRVWLLVTLFDTKISLKKLAKELQAPELRFASPKLLTQYLGVTPGAVSPFGLINDVEHQVNVVLDTALFDHEQVGFHPLHNEATTLIKPADLKKFIEHLGNTIILKPLTQNN